MHQRIIHYWRKIWGLATSAILLCTLPCSNVAQSHILEAGVHKGPILAVYPTFPKTNGAFVSELGWRSVNDTSSFWQKLHNYPETGVSLTFADYGNKAVLGYGIGIQYKFQQVHRITDWLYFFKGTSWGALIATKPFHYLRNPDNITTGGYLSMLPTAFLGLKFNLSNKLQLQSSFMFWHSSNAHTGLPNIGINIPALNASLSYYLDGFKRLPKPTSMYPTPKEWKFGSRVALGLNEFGSVTPVNGPNYGIFLVSSYAMKHVSPIDRLQFGVDLYYNSSYRSFLESQDVAKLDPTFINSSVATVFAANEILYKRVGVVVQVGYYVHNPFLRYYIKDALQAEKTGQLLKAHMPGRLGMNFYIKDPLRHTGTNAFIGMAVKSNMGQADFMDLTVGVTF